MAWRHTAGPLTLRCPKCKIGEDWRILNRDSGQNIVSTGRVRIRARVGKRHDVEQYEVQHQSLRCHFWTWWTTHPHGRPRKA